MPVEMLAWPPVVRGLRKPTLNPVSSLREEPNWLAVEPASGGRGECVLLCRKSVKKTAT